MTKNDPADRRKKCNEYPGPVDASVAQTANSNGNAGENNGKIINGCDKFNTDNAENCGNNNVDEHGHSIAANVGTGFET